eukprot:6196921-Pleurochrysis_carterae.AAC.1
MTCNLPTRMVLVYDVCQYANIGSAIVDEPCPSVACLAVYTPCDISSSFIPQPPNPYSDYIGSPFYKDLRYGYLIYGQSYRAYLGGVAPVMDLCVWGSLIPSAPLRA